jgi:hypothetical protein
MQDTAQPEKQNQLREEPVSRHAKFLVKVEKNVFSVNF